MNATWLILPVVICLSQRLSHACGSIPEREPEKRLPHPRKAAGANYPILTRGGIQSKSLNEDPLEGKSGASSRGNSSSNSLVVEPWDGSPGPPLVITGRLVSSVGDTLLALTGRVVPPALRTTAKAFAKDVFINQERKLGARRRSDTVLVSTINDADQGSADVAFRTPLAPYEKSKFLGSGGSMVARLKLKGIDGRAPPGVEPAA
ncbi:hypothetical protein YC2023_108696 [Brassica napus]